MRNVLRRFILAMALLPCLARAQPADPSRAAEFVRQTGAELASVVAGATSAQDKAQRLSVFLNRVVDEDGVARFCLGRYWQLATPGQRDEYVRLFKLQLLRGVIERLGSFQAGATKITINTPVPRADGILVPTIVEKDGNKPVSIGWLVEADGSSMKLADVMAEGVSLRLTERSDYASFLARHGGEVGALIDALHQQLGE